MQFTYLKIIYCLSDNNSNAGHQFTVTVAIVAWQERQLSVTEHQDWVFSIREGKFCHWYVRDIKIRIKLSFQILFPKFLQYWLKIKRYKTLKRCMPEMIKRKMQNFEMFWKYLKVLLPLKYCVQNYKKYIIFHLDIFNKVLLYINKL